MRRSVSTLAALSLCAAAYAQTGANPAIQQVQGLAPQLTAFAGSAGNFESLVDGLTLGTPVTLTTVAPDGSVQIVIFASGSPLSALDAARLLESTRQRLISSGIATPTAQQLAAALAGPSAVQSRVVPPPANGANLSAADLTALRAGLAQNNPVTLPGASGNVTFEAPGRQLSPFEVDQALQLAGFMLARQGIVDPTSEQLRAALLGGTVGTPGAGVPLRGVLQGQVRNTSDSPRFGTSDSRAIGTSDTLPQPAGNASAGSAAAGGAAAPAGIAVSRARAPAIGRR